jgi:hypothetical protein
MKKETVKTIKAFLFELVVYSILVVAYFFCVLHFLGRWLLPLFQHHHILYASAALALILGQAVLLEILTTFLLRLVRGRSE